MRARWLLLLIPAVPILAAVGVLSYANSEGGRHFIERRIDSASLRVTGLAGSLPGRVEVARIDLADRDGVWATIEGLSLDWSPLALLRGEASIRTLSARRVSVRRRPLPEASGASGGGALPLHVSLQRLEIDRVELAEPVVGAAASLTASGSADLSSLWHSRADLAVKRLDGEGEYTLHVRDTQAELTADEPAQGLMARLADLPDLGRLHVKASMAGPLEAEKIQVELAAGPLAGEGHGTADFKGRRLDLDLGIRSPAMTPRPGLSWTAARLEAHVHGAFDRPEAEGHLGIEGIAAAGSGLDRVEADLRGQDGKLGLSARLIGLHPRGVPPKLLGDAPVELTAEATLAGGEKPVDFTLSHPLLKVAGHTALSEGAPLSAEATVPDLAALAPLTGIDLQGRATLEGKRDAQGQVSLEGRLDEGRQVLRLTADGTIADKIDLRWSAEAPDVAKLGAPVGGAVSAKGTLEGGAAAFSAAAEAQGMLAGAPLSLALTVDHGADGATRIAIRRARWKSVEAGGTLDLAPKSGRASGSLRARAGDLGDFSPFAGMALTGSAEATLGMEAGRKPRAVIHADVRQASWPSGRIGHLVLEGSVEDPLAHPATSLRFAAEEIQAAGFGGKAIASAEGPETALKLSVSADLQGPKGPASLSFEGVAALPEKRLRLDRFEAGYAGGTAHLLAPASIAYGGPVRLDGVKLGLGAAEIDADGQAAPELALDLVLKKADLAYLQHFLPSFPVKGTLAGEAHLRGDPSAPQGDIHLTGRDLRWRGSARAALEAKAQLRGGSALLDVRLDSGKTGALTLTGSAPIGGEGDLDLSARGTLDLGILESLLAAEGREARGRITLDATISGSTADPHIGGEAELQDVSLQDYKQGLHLSAIQGRLQADRDVLRLSGVSGKAGPGRFTLEGTVGVLQPGMPVDIAVKAQNARPLSSDLLTAEMDADLTLGGTVAGGLSLAGKIKVNHADINIPDSLPPTVATLKVTKKGAAPAPPEPPGAPIALDVAVDAPEQIFVRGRGVDAEMGGQLHAGGTSDDPQVEGGFDLRQGTFNLVGQTMTVTRGRIGFDGGGPGGKLDPALDLTVESASNGIDATLAVSGYADAPVLKLTSSPDLPQDEILARLLFNESVSQLTPLQLASIAQGVAQMSGAGGGFDPMALLRKHLGIDRLSVSSSGSSAEGNSNTMVEAGKYVANGVYVGTRQGLNGGTQAKVQIDLTRHLKLDTVIGTGGGTPATGTTIDNDPGSSIGLSWQYDYQ